MCRSGSQKLVKDYFTTPPSPARDGLMIRERIVNIVNTINIVFITYAHIRIYVCAFVHLNVHMCTHMFVYMCIHVYACIFHLCPWTGVRSIKHT